MLLDVDVINMSLGSASGFDTDVSGILSGVLQKLEEAGIILAVAAGNDTNTAANNPLNPAGLPQVENPDHGIVSPSPTRLLATTPSSIWAGRSRSWPCPAWARRRITRASM